MPILRITYTRTDDTLPPVEDLAHRLTEIILSRHGLSRWADQLREMFRVRLHEVPQGRFLSGGKPSRRGLYDIEYILPAGTLTDDVREVVAHEVCKGVLDWEGVTWDEVEAMRVMLIITEVPHDGWFWGGRAVTPRSILDYLGKLRRIARRVSAPSVRRKEPEMA